MWLLVHNIHVDTAVRRGLLIILTHILHVCFFPRTAPIYACFARVLSSAAFLPRSALILLAALGGSIAGREFALLLWQSMLSHTQYFNSEEVLYPRAFRVYNTPSQQYGPKHEHKPRTAGICSKQLLMLQGSR